MILILKTSEDRIVRRGMCGSVGRFGLTTGATSSTKGFGEPWLRRTVESRLFGSDGCMLIEKTVKGSVVFIR